MVDPTLFHYDDLRGAGAETPARPEQIGLCSGCLQQYCEHVARDAREEDGLTDIDIFLGIGIALGLKLAEKKAESELARNN